MRLQKFNQWGLIALVAVMPFHAFASIWLGSLTGHQTLWQAWKEILLVLMLLVAAVMWVNNPKIFSKLEPKTRNLIVGFVCVSIIISLLSGIVGSPAWLHGVKTDLAFLLLFVVAQLVSGKLSSKLSSVLLTSAIVVAFLGVLQQFIDPTILEKLGYGPGTIAPLQQIAGTVQRSFSTLGGPNQLGSFLILPLCLWVAKIAKTKEWKKLWIGLPLLAALFLSFSRSAWLGAVAGLAITLALCLPKKGVKAAAALLASAGLLIVAVLGAIGPNSTTIFFQHGSPAVPGVGSDDQRLNSYSKGVSEIIAKPAGQGLGSAGPASYKSSKPLIPESWYLQIAIETGILGLILYIGIEIALGMRLWQLRQKNPLAAPLLGALAGIAMVNLFLHGWADSSTALVYWGIAGTVVGENA